MYADTIYKDYMIKRHHTKTKHFTGLIQRPVAIVTLTPKMTYLPNYLGFADICYILTSIVDY